MRRSPPVLPIRMSSPAPPYTRSWKLELTPSGVSFSHVSPVCVQVPFGCEARHPECRSSSAFCRSLPQPPHSVSCPVPPASQSLPRSPKIASLPSDGWFVLVCVQLPWLSTATHAVTQLPVKSSLLRKKLFGKSVRSALPVQTLPFGA